MRSVVKLLNTLVFATNFLSNLLLLFISVTHFSRYKTVNFKYNLLQGHCRYIYHLDILISIFSTLSTIKGDMIMQCVWRHAHNHLSWRCGTPPRCGWCHRHRWYKCSCVVVCVGLLTRVTLYPLGDAAAVTNCDVILTIRVVLQRIIKCYWAYWEWVSVSHYLAIKSDVILTIRVVLQRIIKCYWAYWEWVSVSHYLAIKSDFSGCID